MEFHRFLNYYKDLNDIDESEVAERRGGSRNSNMDLDRLFINLAKLSYSTEESSLLNAFEEFGEVSSAKIIMDRDTGRSKGFGFVEMPNDEEARAAISALNDSQIDDRTIVVKEAHDRNGRAFSAGVDLKSSGSEDFDSESPLMKRGLALCDRIAALEQATIAQFKPWISTKMLADGPDIMNYLKEAAEEYDVFKD
ncbi:unnamed protein product, partial [Cyprideis torosa]